MGLDAAMNALDVILSTLPGTHRTVLKSIDMIPQALQITAMGTPVDLLASTSLYEAWGLDRRCCVILKIWPVDRGKNLFLILLQIMKVHEEFMKAMAFSK